MPTTAKPKDWTWAKLDSVEVICELPTGTQVMFTTGWALISPSKKAVRIVPLINRTGQARYPSLFRTSTN